MTVFNSTDILLPTKEIDLKKWSVIACDQFTSQPEYWDDVKKIVGTHYSTINLILPEAELQGDLDERIRNINQTMSSYLDKNLFTEYQNVFVYVERVMNNGMVRTGVVGAVDLEAYEYSSESGSCVRATEETVVERIPVRVAIREDAFIELPHIIMLCNDKKQELIESITSKKEQLKKLYEFELMNNGGRITGWLLDGQHATMFRKAVERYEESVICGDDGRRLMYAIGDGNHSLATAKACYVKQKKKLGENNLDCLARYALVELENIYSETQAMEPIHRIVTHINVTEFLENLYETFDTNTGCEITWYSGSRRGKVCLGSQQHALPVEALQDFLDDYIKSKGGVIDYVHGQEVLLELAKQENAMGFLMPNIKKESLFDDIAQNGLFPRKTFSMGHANEKRYYLEARRIRDIF